MATLSEMFELEMPTVHSIISKMIINEELMVGLDVSVLWTENIDTAVSSGAFIFESVYICGYFLYAFNLDTPIFLFPTGVTRPAHTDGGDAPH